MQRWTALGFATLTAIACATVVVERGDRAHPRPSASADAGAGDAGQDGAAPDGGGPSDAEAPAMEGTGPLAPGVLGDDGAGSSDAGLTLLSGEAAPALAATAPKSVTFGVILIGYKGAQGAPPNAPSRDDALARAKQLAEDAKKDFKAAVARGDKGSMESAGKMPRGMLEPAPEYVLFSLPKDGVSDPVETPRGFWILHRIE